MIKTERLVIKELVLEDALQIFENSHDEDIKEFVPDEYFDTYEEALDTVKWLIESQLTNVGPFLYPIFYNDINIGYVEFCQIDDFDFEVGYHIAKQYTKKGFATEAVKAMTPIFMERMGLSQIYGVVLEENIASSYVLLKAGFELQYMGESIYQGEKKQIRQFIYKK